MTRDDGFSLLEAVVALAIVGLAAVASTEAVAAHLRAAERTVTALEQEALVQDRLARTRLLAAEELAHLPDSMAGGKFEVPWDEVAWRAASEADRSRPGLFQVTVEIGSGASQRRIETRVYRPRTTPRRAESRQ
ncbi:MAG: type II secretion system protein [Gemmatimonadales bacterium]